MATPLVSVIIPYYNRPQKMQRCLDTVLRQTYSNFEVFVIDDASHKVFEHNQESRVNVIRNVKNLGPGPSRNIGVQRAKGEFVVFLDSDDYWDANFLEVTVAALVNNSAAVMVYANGVNVNEHGKTIGVRRNQIKHLDRILPDILSVNRHWGTGGCLWRKMDIQNIQWIASRSWEDYAFDIDVAIRNNSIIGLKETLVYYDSSGKDKLSENTSDARRTQKVMALQHISDSLYASPWREDSMIKKALSYLILMNFLEYPTRDEKQLLLKIFNRWSGFFNRFLLKMVFTLPESQRMYFLELVTSVYRKQRR